MFHIFCQMFTDFDIFSESFIDLRRLAEIIGVFLDFQNESLDSLIVL